MSIDLAPTPSSRKLRIAVVGVGGIGSTFAFQLARTGQHDVTVIARPGSLRFQQLKRDSGIVNTRNEKAPVCVADSLDETVEYDLVLMTLPAHQAEAVLPALQRSAAQRIQFMFNVFDPERLRDAVGADRCSFGMPFVQGSIDPNGKLNAKIGAGGQKSKMNDRRWVDLFNNAGLPAYLNRTCFSGFAAMFRCALRLKVSPLLACGAEAVRPGAKRSPSHEG